MGCCTSTNYETINDEAIYDSSVYDGYADVLTSECTIHELSVDDYLHENYPVQMKEGDLLSTGKISAAESLRLNKFPVSMVINAVVTELKEGVIIKRSLRST